MIAAHAVADHIRLTSGGPRTGDDYGLVRALFLRVLGAIYLVAFLSFWSQADGLMGSGGILPVGEHLAGLRERFGARAYGLAPTLLWLDASDLGLHVLCGTGVLCSLALLLGVLQRLALVLLFACYLSLSTAGQVFTQFQWDIFLLEVGFLAIFLGPSPVTLWLFRWLLFRFMFLSGVVKLASGDRTWRDLSALRYHFETQPLPTPLAWYVHQLPDGVLRAATVAMFLVELVVPFLVFGPRRLRLTAAALIAGLEGMILLTGNYNFFNLLTIVLCLFLLDDRVLRRMRQVVMLREQAVGGAGRGGLKHLEGGRWPAFVGGVRLALPRYALPALAAAILAVGLMQMVGAFTRGTVRPFEGVLSALAPFRVVNPYGVFAVMTTRRDEIVLEGSSDGESWVAYEFRYKPGDVGRAPPWVQPHQPRVDWQMWFAALGNYQQNPWLVRLAQRLLQGSPQVLGLLEGNPFPDAPPRFVRARVYTYRFTTVQERERTGAWWRRTFRREYLPSVSLTR